MRHKSTSIKNINSSRNIARRTNANKTLKESRRPPHKPPKNGKNNTATG